MAVVLVVVTLAACGSKPAAKRATTTVPTTTTTLPPTAPLTGLPESDPSILSRPAVLVKIDNAPEARPQNGLDKADVVYEEVVEGGITRYLAIFQSQDASPVGPVRSVRQTDADVVQPIGGLFGYSGGIPAFVNDVHQAGVTDVGAVDDASAYYRSSSRAAPHNLYTSTTVLRQKTPPGMGPPPPLFVYGTAATVPTASAATPATHVVVAMSPATVAAWDWNAATGLWQRTTDGTPQTVQAGGPLAFTNVVVEFVPYQNTGFVDPSGAPVPDANTVGTGQAVVLTDGRIIHGTWSKTTAAAVTTYSDALGKPIRLIPGTTWVMLAPTGVALTAS